MDANVFGTAAYLKSKHVELQQKWVTHSEKVEELWRFLRPIQRDMLFRAGLKQGKVLKDPKDRSIFQSYALYPEMNVRDITLSPEHFLDHFEFRATSGLKHQHRIGLKGAKGDHQVIAESMVLDGLRSKRDFRDGLMFFLDEDKYGDIYKAKDEEDYKSVFDNLVSKVAAGVVVPRGVGELILERQCYLIQHLCVLVDNTLKLGAIIDEGVKESMTPKEEARLALSAYPDDEKPHPICVQDLITVSVDRKLSLEAYWDLCRSSPAFLANAVNLWYSTRPGLVPDEKGRRMPLTSDEYLSRAVFEVIHSSVIGIAIWDIISALLQNFVDPSDDAEQDIISQEISNICHYEYNRVRKDFKRFVQIGSGSKYFRRLSKVFDNGAPRVVLKPIPDRLIKEDPQLHYILRLCQLETGAAQAVQWNNMLAYLHHNQPLEQDKLEEWEFDALGEVSLTINLVNTVIASLDLPSNSPKKGLTYISKLNELITRLDPLKAHTNLRRLPISLDDLKNPDTAKEALRIVDRFSEYYAGGSMVTLYQNLNKEFLEDLEVQLQEANVTKKTNTKHLSKSAGAHRSMTQGRKGQEDKTDSRDLSLASLSRKLASFLKDRAKVSDGSKISRSEVGALNCLQQQSTALSDTALTEPPAPEESSKNAQLESPAETELEMPSKAQAAAEEELYHELSISTIMEALAELSLSEPQSDSESERSFQSDTHAKPGTTVAESAIVLKANVEMAATELELCTEADVSAGPEDSEGREEPESDQIAENIQSEPSQEADFTSELGSHTGSEMSASEDTNKFASEAPTEPKTSSQSATAGDETAEIFKVSRSTAEVFTTIFSALEESEANPGSRPGPKYSIKWLDFGTAMNEIGFSILPSLGYLYTFVPSEDSDVGTFLTLHHPYRSVIHGDGLLLLALRLKLLYGWGKETFEAE